MFLGHVVNPIVNHPQYYQKRCVHIIPNCYMVSFMALFTKLLVFCFTVLADMSAAEVISRMSTS